MSKPLRVAVVGVGRMGRHHARIYSELPDVELMAVIDVNADRAREVASAYGCRALRDVSELPGPLDALCLSTLPCYWASPA